MHRFLAPLDRPGGRTLIAHAMEWRIRRVHGERVRVRYDDDDHLWLFQWPDAAVPMVEPIATSPQEFEQAHRDVFFQDYTPGPGDLIVDVGAGMGSELNLMCRSVGPAGRVYAIEADPLTFRCLQLRCELNRLDSVVAVHAAISDEVGEAIISSEGHHLGHRLVDGGPGSRVEALTLDELVRRHGIERIDYLKVNIEGAEERAFAGLRESFGLVRNIAVSCHDFVGCPTRDAVTARLSAEGFTLAGRRPDDAREWARSWLYASRG